MILIDAKFNEDNGQNVYAKFPGMQNLLQLNMQQ